MGLPILNMCCLLRDDRDTYRALDHLCRLA